MSQERLQAHASIGLAVLSCQALEMLFALCVKLAFKHKDIDDLREITPLEKNFSKPSMKVLLSELRKYTRISNSFEETLLNLIERRHDLIHRWGIKNGLPNDLKSFKEIKIFADLLAKDANELSNTLYGYVVDWINKFPEFQSEFAKEQTAISSAFRQDSKKMKIEPQ